MYNIHNMAKHVLEEKAISETDTTTKEAAPGKKSARWAYAIGILGIVITILMVVAIIYFGEQVRKMAQFGYVGAFFISILGGATIIVPVPMLAIVFALGGVVEYPWALALSAAAGELVGAMTIYMTGHGAGKAISNSGSKHGRLQKVYDKLMDLMRRRGTLTLFIVTSIVNPFFYPAAFAAGALRFGLKKYVPIVLAGKIIKSFTVVYAGYFGLKGIFHAIGINL